MIIMYALLVAYILAVNFYAFLLIKTLKQQETERELIRQSAPLNPEQVKPEKYLGKFPLLSNNILFNHLTPPTFSFIINIDTKTFLRYIQYESYYHRKLR